MFWHHSYFLFWNQELVCFYISILWQFSKNVWLFLSYTMCTTFLNEKLWRVWRQVKKTAQMASVGDQEESRYIFHICWFVSKSPWHGMKTKHSMYSVLTINTSQLSALMKVWASGVGSLAAGVQTADNGWDNLLNWCHYWSAEILSMEQLRVLLLVAPLQWCSSFQ